MSLGGGRSTDAATAGDGRGRSSATGPHRHRRAGQWEAVGGSPDGGRRDGVKMKLIMAKMLHFGNSHKKLAQSAYQ